MTRPVRALIDIQALSHNLKQVRDTAPNSKVMAVVKADAYGHGLAAIANTLMEAHAFAVASFDEGLVLRNAGVAHPICLLEGFFDAQELNLLNHYRFSSVVHNLGQLEQLEHCQSSKPIDVWLKADTGMNRIGFAPDEVPDALARLQKCKTVGRVRLLSHLARADDRTDKATNDQVALFTQLAAGRDLECSLANSAGVVAWPQSHFDWVRPGIMLYGASPVEGCSAAELGLHPVMTLTSQLIAVNYRRKGDCVGYGGEWICPEDMPVGVVAIGYGDGYPRLASALTPVLVNGKRAPLIGRVSMDMITVDLRGRPDAQVGDPVVLWGQGLPVEEIAAHAGTIAYELLARMPKRVPRVQVNRGEA